MYDVVPDGGAPVIVFEYVPGESLAARLARVGRLPEPEAARLAAEVAEALAHAHTRGVVHRDVKPANILIDPDGRARLVDFGIARTVQEAQTRLTNQGDVMGTLRYMAPEQLADGSPGPSIDIFALGAVLYEMLVGRPAFDAPTPVALLRQHEQPPAPAPDVSPALMALCLACLRRDPARRPATAAEVAQFLRGWLAGSASALRPENAATAATAPTVRVAPPAARDAPRPPHAIDGDVPSPSARRSGWADLGLAALTGAVVGAMLVAGAFAVGSVRIPGIGSPAGAGAGSTASSPPPTQTPTPAPTTLTIVEPADGATAEEPRIQVRGTAPPGQRVTRDGGFFFFDEYTFADGEGRWSMEVELGEGENVLTFWLGDDAANARRVRVFHVPSG